MVRGLSDRANHSVRQIQLFPPPRADHMYLTLIVSVSTPGIVSRNSQRDLQTFTRCLCQVLRKLRRLAWAENEAYLVRCMLAAAKARFDDLPLVASLAAGLSRYHPSLAIALPDALLEEACLSSFRGFTIVFFFLLLSFSLNNPLNLDT